jgi:hypothetical protein
VDRSDVEIGMRTKAPSVATGTSNPDPASKGPTRRVALRCGILAAVGLGVSLTPQVSEAKDIDMREGTFVGNWCGLEAVFTLKASDKKKYKFEGTVFLPATRQKDKITVQQLEDYSLYLVRSLSGTHAGETQGMQTHPPERLVINGKTVVNWPAKKTYGYGAKLAGFLRMPAK